MLKLRISAHKDEGKKKDTDWRKITLTHLRDKGLIKKFYKSTRKDKKPNRRKKKKRAQDLHRKFTQRCSPRINKYSTRCLVSALIRGVLNQIMSKCQYRPSRMAKNRQSGIACLGKKFPSCWREKACCSGWIKSSYRAVWG